MMDSTHKTNTWDWRLFTLTVRNKNASYLPAFQFLVEREDSASVGEALQAIRAVVPTWYPRYWVVDDSAVEQNGIRNAFPGISVGEGPISIFLCTVHTMRTWRRNVTDKHLITLLVQALHKTTETGCRLILEEALKYAETLPVPPPRRTKNADGSAGPLKARTKAHDYILNTVLPKARLWALFSRQSVPALLQMSTTNAAESYHRLLKRWKRSMRKSSFRDLFQHVSLINDKRFSDAAAAAVNFLTKQVSLTRTMPEFKKFSYPVQRLMATEY